MPLIRIDGKEYELDLLSTATKQYLTSLQFVDTELQRLQAQTAVLKTARASYVGALQASLPKTEDMLGAVIQNIT